MDRCGCYIRVSTVNQKDNFSVDVQRKRAKTFCKANGLEAVFYDAIEIRRLLKDQ